MKIDDYSKKVNRKRETVIGWIKNELIPGANLEEDYVPDSARVPYNARAKKGYGLLKSILKACDEGKGITSKTYHISEEQFKACVELLIQGGFLHCHNENGIEYYDITMMGHEKLQIFKGKDWMELIVAFVSALPFLASILQ